MLQITTIDPNFVKNKEERLYDLTYYLSIKSLDKINQVIGTTGVDGLYNRTEAIRILGKYIPTEAKRIHEVEPTIFLLSNINEKLCDDYVNFKNFYQYDYDIIKIVEQLNLFLGVEISEVVKYSNMIYVPFELVMDRFEDKNGKHFSFLRAEGSGYELLESGGMVMVPIELLIQTTDNENYIEFDETKYLKDIELVVEEYAYIFMDKKPNELVKSLKLKIDKTLRKTYIMIDTKNGLYKIGYSKNPEKREKTLQSESPTVKLLATLNENIEKELHERYKSFRVRGEWFNLGPIQIAELHFRFKNKKNKKKN